MKKTVFLLVLALTYLTISHAQKLDRTTDTLTLNETVVEGKYQRSYAVNRISSSLRIPENVLKMPQNIQIVSSSMLKDQMALNITESVTRNVSGAFREELHNGISADIYMRGGYISAQRNGVDLRPLLKGPIGDDAAIVENIEFIKGPSGFMNSLGDAAGAYNVVTKKPTGTNRSTFKATQGSFGLMRGEADFDGSFDSNSKLMYRFNIMGMHKDGFFQHDNNERILLAPSIKYMPSNDMSITVEYIYQRLNFAMLSEAQISPYGFASLPIDFTLTDPTARPYRMEDHNVFVNFQKKLGKQWEFTAQVADVNSRSTGAIFWVYGKNEADPDILDRYYVYDGMKYNTYSAQAFIKGSFLTGDLKHNLLAGIDYNHKTNSTQDTWATATTIYPLSISNPVYAQVVNNNGIGGNFESENSINGIENMTDSKLYYTSGYIMDEITLLNKRLRISGGVRLTQYEADFDQYGDKTDASGWVATPRAGVNYLISKTFSIYGLFDNTFIPQAGKAYDNTPLKPVRGQSFEAGLKKEWNKEALSTSLTVYHIKRTRNVVNDPVSNHFYQLGENVSKGVEVDIRGRIARGLNAIINYAYTDAKVTKDDINPAMVGQATPNRVRHIQNTWLTYEMPIAALDGLSLSIGYQYLAGRAERFTSPDPSKLDNLFRVDGGVSFTKKRYSINLVVNNILNSHQYSTAWKRNDMYYWVQLAPVNYRCSVCVNF